MNKYGVVAINAARLILNDGNIQPLTAWNSAASSPFGEGTSSQMDVVLSLWNSKLIVEE